MNNIVNYEYKKAHPPIWCKLNSEKKNSEKKTFRHFDKTKGLQKRMFPSNDSIIQIHSVCCLYI